MAEIHNGGAPDSYDLKPIMMSFIRFIVPMAFFLVSVLVALAQDSQEDRIRELEAEKEMILTQEKEALKGEVVRINARLEAGEISPDEAERLKKEAAEMRALNIENRTAIMENKIRLYSRNGTVKTDSMERSLHKNVERLEIGIGATDEEGETLFGVSYTNHKVKRPREALRTTSDPIFVFGLSNVLVAGSLNDSPFKVGGSRFAELGWAWRTRVLPNANGLRFVYGASFQFNGYRPTDNRYFEVHDGEAQLVDYPYPLSKSKFRTDNLVVPLYVELGPSKRVNEDGHLKYATLDKFRIGLGGYFGLNLGARQKLKYERDGHREKDKLKKDYGTTNFVYGLNGYLGVGFVQLYVKYDLNTLFHNGPENMNAISFGLRFDHLP